MSRGLGIMQRTLLLNLDSAKSWANADIDEDGYGYGRYIGHGGENGARRNMIVYRGKRVELCDSAYDLSAVRMFLAEKLGKTRSNWETSATIVDGYFNSAFWRAAKRLIDTGYLASICEVEDRDQQLVSLDGTQRRIVCLTELGEFVLERLSVDDTAQTLKDKSGDELATTAGSGSYRGRGR